MEITSQDLEPVLQQRPDGWYYTLIFEDPAGPYTSEALARQAHADLLAAYEAKTAALVN